MHRKSGVAKQLTAFIDDVLREHGTTAAKVRSNQARHAGWGWPLEARCVLSLIHISEPTRPRLI
eukprot:781962-Amphidinium_carterae.1